MLRIKRGPSDKFQWPRSDILALLGVITATVGSLAAVFAIPELHDKVFGRTQPEVPLQYETVKEFDVYFDYDKYNIRQESMQIIEAASSMLASNPENRAVLVALRGADVDPRSHDALSDNQSSSIAERRMGAVLTAFRGFGFLPSKFTT